MKSALVYTAEGGLNTKSQRQRDLVRAQLSGAPASYKTNSIKEELCMEYVHSFLEQYMQAYKTRALPYMIAENEFGVNKFVCTTLRPTQIPVPELYDMYECAAFLAGYNLYEPLDPPFEPPKYLFSPQQVLESHRGDCFDLSNLLCSFLLGGGYDAYMVYGYAPKFITLKDQSRTTCPMIHNEHQDPQKAKASDQQQQSENQEGSDNHYIPPDNTVKSSKFIADLAEKKRQASIDTFQLWIPDQPLDESKMMEEERLREKELRVHAWVLVKAGRRDIKEDVFIEASTGRIYAAKNCPYISVENVWNHQNFFVNTNLDTKMAELQFNFANDKLWEALFLGKPKSGKEAQADADGNDDHDLMDESQNPETESKTAIADEAMRFFDAPTHWSAPLALPRHKYLMKYPPNGKRTAQYYCAKADFFAKGTNEQAMVMRITTYLNQECTIVKEIHEWFENRVDRMYKRIRYFLDNRRFVEFFTPGSRGEIKKWTEFPGKSIEVDYYVNGRLDRLLRREEIIGQSVTETFQGRTDLMTYRAVQLTADKGAANIRQFTLPPSQLGTELYITRIVQQFERNPSLPDGTDIAKRIFYVREGKAVFYFHFGKSQISGKIKTYMHTKGPSIPAPTDLALSQEVGLDEDLESCQEAAALERECYSSIKTSFQAHDKLCESRLDGEVRVEQERTVFEKALDSAESHSAMAVNQMDATFASEARGTDYLTPFLRNVNDPSQISKEDALSIRQACLDALKARLVERANIIQSKLHEENAKLGRKQELFQRSQREGDFSTEEYEKYCTEAMFRIQILEQRLAAHEEAALRKFADLDLKLSNDPRLKVLKS